MIHRHGIREKSPGSRLALMRAQNFLAREAYQRECAGWRRKINASSHKSRDITHFLTLTSNAHRLSTQHSSPSNKLQCALNSILWHLSSKSVRSACVMQTVAFTLHAVRITAPSQAWPHSNYEVELFSRHYGAQMTGPCLKFHEVVYGSLPTAHPARLLQLNRFVTAGLTPSGEMNGYQPVFRKQIREASNTDVTRYTESSSSKHEVRHNTIIHFISSPSAFTDHPLPHRSCKRPRPRYPHQSIF